MKYRTLLGVAAAAGAAAVAFAGTANAQFYKGKAVPADEFEEMYSECAIRSRG